MNLKRIYHPYSKWEDFQHGLYKEEKEGREARVQQSILLLKSPIDLERAMDDVIFEWRYACESYLSYNGYNRQAWLGQAACCFNHEATESETREAWSYLTIEERDKANAVADIFIRCWERRFNRENISRSECVTSC